MPLVGAPTPNVGGVRPPPNTAPASGGGQKPQRQTVARPVGGLQGTATPTVGGVRPAPNTAPAAGAPKANRVPAVRVDPRESQGASGLANTLPGQNTAAPGAGGQKGQQPQLRTQPMQTGPAPQNTAPAGGGGQKPPRPAVQPGAANAGAPPSPNTAPAGGGGQKQGGQQPAPQSAPQPGGTTDTRGLGINLGLNGKQANDFRQAVASGSLSQWLDQAGLKDEFGERLNSGQYGDLAKQYLAQNAQNAKANGQPGKAPQGNTAPPPNTPQNTAPPGAGGQKPKGNASGPNNTTLNDLPLDERSRLLNAMASKDPAEKAAAQKLWETLSQRTPGYGGAGGGTAPKPTQPTPAGPSVPSGPTFEDALGAQFGADNPFGVRELGGENPLKTAAAAAQRMLVENLAGVNARFGGMGLANSDRAALANAQAISDTAIGLGDRLAQIGENAYQNDANRSLSAILGAGQNDLQRQQLALQLNQQLGGLGTGLTGVGAQETGIPNLSEIIGALGMFSLGLGGSTSKGSGAQGFGWKR